MNIELRAPKGATRRRKRVGRGQSSGWGETAGRGVKGQKARSGGKVRIGFEGGQMPLYRRLPRRGFSNHPFKKVYTIVKLPLIEKNFAEGDTVNFDSLVQCGILKKSEKSFKILGGGELKKKLTFQVSFISEGAALMIKEAGGSVEMLNPTESKSE